MKKILPAFLRSLLVSGVLLLMGASSSYASHIVAAELRYKWVSGYNYQVTVYLYGDCGASSRASYNTLPDSQPWVCIYNGNSFVNQIHLNVVNQTDSTVGLNVTPVCPDSSNYTTCQNLIYDIPGITKFVYTNTVTLPSGSQTWRFIYQGYNGALGGAVSGRTMSITNLFNPSSTDVQLIDTLNTETTRGHNSSPELTVEPIPYFCGFSQNCYNPGATDIYDTSELYDEPSGDSLVFHLATPTGGDGSPTCSPTFSLTYCTYEPGLMAWPGQPIGPTTPIQCTEASFSFDSATGQLCFDPNFLQRSTVLYNIDEFFKDPVMGIVLTGSIQREMNFLVQTCIYIDPVGNIDSTSGSGYLSLDSTHYFACQYTDTFTLTIAPKESDGDTTLTTTITATGLVDGLTCTITNNGTNDPVATIIGNTSIMTPGDYTVTLTYNNNLCPLEGTNVVAITITVLPVPTIKDSLLAAPTCNSKAAYLITPGGTGKPWTIKVDTGGLFDDTIQVFTDTSAFVDSLRPGLFYLTIFTATSNNCAITDTIKVLPEVIKDTAYFTDPTYCGSATGTIILDSLLPLSIDSVTYRYNYQWQTMSGFVSTDVGSDTLTGLLAGIYDSITVHRGYCVAYIITPLDLVNPPFTLRNISFTNPTKHCFCDGTDTLYGLHPGQLDTVTYDNAFGVPQPPVIRLVGADSMIYTTGLCAGQYTNILIRTDSVCSALTGPITLTPPIQSPTFIFTPIDGCKSDTVLFTNTSLPLTGLTYRWDFGDGTTDTAKSPDHIYYGIVGMTYSVTLTIVNGACDTSVTNTVLLNNFIDAGFTVSPYPFVCQDALVTFADSSSGVGNGTALTYSWNFGDGSTANTFNATHAYANTGAYQIQLIAGNNIPCYDTAYATLQVDSAGPISISATDSVVCRGSEITFTGNYTTIGETQVNWSFGDNNAILNVNPVVHSFDAIGTLTVTINAQYRACPATTSTRTIQVYPAPNVYLGPDTAMCPGTAPILLTDVRNSGNDTAKWLWSTGATTPGIAVQKPGMYYVVVTIDGCSSSDTVNVQNDCYMSIPNIFTPNGDGVNDYFFPRQELSKNLATFSMNIYNRWGVQVFQTTGIDGRGWDGTFNNIPQPEGVYIYVIDATFGDGEVEHHQGNITLIR